MSENLQFWVRNDKGQVYGPLTPPSVELLIDNEIIGGRLQVSTDGVNYVFPGRVPGLRMIFPKESWGDTVVPGDELDAAWGQVVMPASIHGQGPTSGGSAAPAAGPVGPSSGSGIRGPAAGPGGRGPVAGPGIRGPTAGPGARQLQQPGRPMNPAGAQGRGPSPSSPSGIAAPPMRSSPSVADFMNANTPASRPSGVMPAPSAAPRSSPSGVVAGPPALMPSSPSGVRSSPSVADFMNSASPSAPLRPVVPGASAPRPPAPAPARPSSSSGVRMAASAAPVGDLRVPASGTLVEHSSQQLYYLAASSEATGLLTVELADRELVAHFKKGNPEFLDSTHPEDSLDTFLLAQKLATPAQLEQAQAQGARFGGELLPALFGLGLLNPNAVFQHLGQRGSQLLQRLLSAEQGTFSFDHQELPPSRSMPMGNKWAVYLEALRRVPTSDLRRRLMGALDLPVMRAGGRVQASDLRLTPQETRALNYFDGVRSLSQLLKDVPGEADTLLRTAWMLTPLELVSFAGVSLTAPQAPAAPKPSAAPQPSRVPGPPVMVQQAQPKAQVPADRKSVV